MIRQSAPVIIKELRGRMRGVRAFLILTIYLGALGGLLGVMLWVAERSGSVDPGMGRTLFGVLAVTQMLLMTFLAPAFTASAISQEHEAQTYEMLMATPLPPSAVVLGKLGAAVGFLLLLVFATLPLAALAALFGGVTPGDLLRLVVILTVTALLSGTLGIFCSALVRRSGCATALASLGVLSLSFGCLAGGLVTAVMTQSEEGILFRLLLAGSPLWMLSAFLPEMPDELPPWGATVAWSLALASLLGGASTALVAPVGRRHSRRRLIVGTQALVVGSIAVGLLIALLESRS